MDGVCPNNSSNLAIRRSSRVLKKRVFDDMRETIDDNGNPSTSKISTDKTKYRVSANNDSGVQTVITRKRARPSLKKETKSELIEKIADVHHTAPNVKTLEHSRNIIDLRVCPRFPNFFDDDGDYSDINDFNLSALIGESRSQNSTVKSKEEIENKVLNMKINKYIEFGIPIELLSPRKKSKNKKYKI